MAEYSGHTVTLLSSDDKPFEVPVEVASMCTTIKNMIEDLGEDQLKVPIPIPTASNKILEKIIQYCKHYYEQKLGSKQDISEWEREFCAVEQTVLFEMISAANFLEIKPLLELTCKTVSDMMKGKSPEEIRKIFNIKNDFTPEEEEQVRRENEWCEER